MVSLAAVIGDPSSLTALAAVLIGVARVVEALTAAAKSRQAERGTSS